MNYNEIVETLTAVGKQTETMHLRDGSRVLLMPHGGRVLGLFSRSSAENFYWTNPALASPELASGFYSSGGWENSGGDRTWLSPELDLFFPNYPDLDMEGYLQPRQIDPGSYLVERGNGTIRLINRFSLTFFRSRATLELEIAKWVQETRNPLRHSDGAIECERAEYSGYEQHTVLRILSGQGAWVGIWNLIQMPHRGEMFIPTFTQTEPRVYFGEIPAGDLVTRTNGLRWRMRAAGEQKLGVKATATTGRVSYRFGGSQESLVIRNFSVNPGGEYIDTPWLQTDDYGYSVQACNVDSKWGSFSELEYHVPAIGDAAGATTSEDVSQVWAFRGSAAALDKISELLLGVAG